MKISDRMLLSGNEAIALAAYKSKVALGAGYPGTPSTEILENFSAFGGQAQWSPNEKVALEVAIGAAFGKTRAMATMKHVGLNVAADPLFTAAYTGVQGALVIVCADDPGMASSQNEQDNRNYAAAAGLPMLEPSDSQEAYDFTVAAFELSEKWNIPVILRVTTRICHSKTVVNVKDIEAPSYKADFVRDIKGRVMIPAYARIAHKKLRQKLDEIAAWNEDSDLNQVFEGDKSLGVITSGISFPHSREAAPGASLFKLSVSYPLPIEKIRKFAASVDRCVVIEEGDPYLEKALLAEGIKVEGKVQMYRFGEFNVDRVRRIIAGDESPEAVPAPGKPPQLCQGCPHRIVFQILSDLDCIVSGDIGCYTLGVLPPFQAMDSCVCMGASVSIGLGLRHVLPDEQANRVVSVIGDSTFMHSGITGLVDMVYNKPKTGHVVIILDNGTTAMTGLQEHPGTGRLLDHTASARIDYEALGKSIGIQNVHTIDHVKFKDEFKKLLMDALEKNEPTLLIARKECVLAVRKIRQYEKEAAEQLKCQCQCEGQE